MKIAAPKIHFLITLLLFVAVILLVPFSFYLYTRIDSFAQRLSANNSMVKIVESMPSISTPLPEEDQLFTTTPIATPTTASSPIAVPTPSTIVKKNTDYITLIAQASTNSPDWQNITSSEVWVDLKNDYGDGAKVYFEASLHADSGKAQVRLYDVTHGIGVTGSDIETDKLTTTLVSSGVANLWSGKNLYRVQFRSFDSSKVYIESAKIKIVY